jgi:hypothetical protein
VLGGSLAVVVRGHKRKKGELPIVYPNTIRLSVRRFESQT